MSTVLIEVEKENNISDDIFYRLLQIDSRTRSGQRQEVGYVGWCQQSS